MLRREGADPAILKKFYRAVIQVVLFFGVETWVLSEPMAHRIYGIHVGFLIQVEKLKVKKLRDDSWQKVMANKVLQGAGTQPLQTYLDRIWATMAEWVALWPIFDVCARKTG